MNDEKVLEKNQQDIAEESKENADVVETLSETVSVEKSTASETISVEENTEAADGKPETKTVVSEIKEETATINVAEQADAAQVTPLAVEQPVISNISEEKNLNETISLEQTSLEQASLEQVSLETEVVSTENINNTENGLESVESLVEESPAIDYLKEYEKTLNRLYKDVISGKSLTNIANQLNEEKVLGRTGEDLIWTEEYLKSELKNIKVTKNSEKKIIKEILEAPKKKVEEKKPKNIVSKKEDKKSNKKKEDKKKKVAKAAKKTRMIILAIILYIDVIFAFVFLTKGYLSTFLGGLGNFTNNLMNNIHFTTAVLLIVVFLITNGVAIGLYKDAKNTKRKKADNYSPIIDETESVDGRVEVEEEVEEEAVEDVKAPVYRTSKTIESINIKRVQEDLIDAALEAGVVIDKKTAREVLSAIAGGQLIFVKENEMDLCKKFLQSLSKFFGVEYYETRVPDDASSFDAIMKTNPGTGNILTSFSKSVIAANRMIESINISVLTNVDPSNMMNYFKDVFEQAKNPNLKNEVKIGTRQSTATMYAIPKNFWTICCLKEQETMIPSEIAKYSFFIDLNLKAAEETKEAVERKAISYPQLIDCYNELFEMCYIEEDVWKHLDEFEEYLAARGSYFIDNRIIRQMERFAAIYLALDGEQADVIDALLVNKLLLIALPNTYKKLDNSEETVVGTAEKILGADYIMNCQELLKKIKMN